LNKNKYKRQILVKNKEKLHKEMQLLKYKEIGKNIKLKKYKRKKNKRNKKSKKKQVQI
jgi:hypothetical protein